MKKILSIIAAGALAVLAISCNKDEKATFSPSDVTAPVLGTFTVGSNVVVNFTPAVFDLDFNKQMVADGNVYHTLGMVSVNGEPCNVTLSSAKNGGSSLTLSGKDMTAALRLRGFEIGETVPVELVVRASIQDPSKGVTNGYVDSEDKAAFDWTLTEEKSEGLPAHDGVRVYILDETGWDAIALYMWGDKNDFGGGWPGKAVSGEFNEWKYFEYDNEIFGLAEHLIFNNNGGGTQLADYDLTFETGVADYWLKVSSAGVEAAEAPSFGPALPDIDLTGRSVNDVMAGATTWGVIGPAASDWSTDVDMEKVSDDPEIWVVKNIPLAADSFKFRGNDTWGDYDLGGGTFGLNTVMELSKGGGDMTAEEGTYTIYLYPTYMICYITQ